MIRSSFWSGARRQAACWLLPSFLAGVLPLTAAASVSANLTWIASPDATVTGYTVYYGGASHQYTNSVVVGNVTSVVVPGLMENTTYFFAAKSHDDAGNQSDYSNEAAFAGFNTTPDNGLRLKTLPPNFTGNPLVYSLGAGAPAGATINPTNGTVSWTPGRDNAVTTNYINVVVTDTVNPALSISETLLIFVSDYLEFRLGATAVQTGQASSLPLSVASSSSVTNVVITLAWPGNNLINPKLSFSAPVVSGTLQNLNNQLVIQLQTTAELPLTGTNQVAQVNFQAADGQPSAIFSIPATTATGTAADGSSYNNVELRAGEVVVVGNVPLLRPQADPVNGRTLSLYAIPGNYQLQYATSLAAPVTWTPVMNYQQTNVSQSVSLDSANPVIFYRLQQL
jgi:hypothetical protein